MKWLEIAKYENKFRPLTIFIGGRGIGKTYSTISYVVESKELFLYLRNTQIQVEECASTMGNPFLSYNTDHDRNIKLVAEKKHYLIVEGRPDPEDPDKEIQVLLGYAASLSTFENLRGVDMSNVKYVIFDEFIEKRTLTFDQFDSFSHMYETVSRNRELKGEKPLICFLLSNSQSLFNPILEGYDLVGQIEMMMNHHQDSHTDQDYFICLCSNQEVSERKKDTALYRLTKNSHIYRENIENNFVNDDFTDVQKQNIQEFIPLCSYEGMYIYKHKSLPVYYVCWITATCKSYSEKTRMLFMRSFGMNMREAVSTGRCMYSDMSVKHKLYEVIKI